MKYIKTISLIISFLSIITADTFTQTIPARQVLTIQQLPDYLKADKRMELEKTGAINSNQLAKYFKDQFAHRFFYDHHDFYKRLENYNQLYNNQERHTNRALDHYHKYSDSTQWLLPFNYLNGQPVNAYALRHLARQHKMVDIAFQYFYDNKDPRYIKYFETQMRSLNAALHAGNYEKIVDGNGVYEAFRSGYRIFNWLWIHNMFLNEPEYSNADQLLTIATLLQHGQHLFETNATFRPGNHQTKGMSALAVLAILLNDFTGTDQWYDRAMLRLQEHLDQEINPDGFQFERSVHYHMSDINNYFFVYQLAKINKIKVDDQWEQKLRTLFTTLTKIAYPDRSAPVLQDDTEIPWGEKNDISGAMTLGYLLFENPEFGYFATDKVADRMYWYLSSEQVKRLTNIEQKPPTYGSLAFEDTHYYIMREGWEVEDKVMIISAGLDHKKPDHQHGDMLGIQAIANGQVILPNYQVRYSLKDFELFKNSLVKNVALVDDELQGKEWTSNKGGSGFGKFKKLPHPKVISWESNDALDLFIGSHDGFEPNEVDYVRQVLYVKDAFWIVKDNFQSTTAHDYKQVWQGHYTTELGPNLIRSSFPDAAGCDILQLHPVDTFKREGARGKNWTLLTKTNETNFNFLTIIFPYQGYQNRIEETKPLRKVGDWIINHTKTPDKKSTSTTISKDHQSFFFDIQETQLEDLIIQSSMKTDFYIALVEDQLTLQLLGPNTITLKVYQTSTDKNNAITKVLRPGEQLLFQRQ